VTTPQLVLAQRTDAIQDRQADDGVVYLAPRPAFPGARGHDPADVSLAVDTLPDRFGFDPAREAEWRDLLAALRRAVDTELSPRQRQVFVAIVVNAVPLDALAVEFSSSRSATYKIMFDARRKLRAALAANGYTSNDTAGPLMNGRSELDRFLRTAPRDVGRAQAMEMLHVYAELVAAGEPTGQRTPASPRTCKHAVRAAKTSRRCWLPCAMRHADRARGERRRHGTVVIPSRSPDAIGVSVVAAGHTGARVPGSHR
jgi:hypothetical protein